MVHIGCGADVIRQRRRNEELRKEAEALGLVVSNRDFKPAKNKKFPHFTAARDKGPVL
jgi:2'-5' RNA ligase